MLHGKGDAVVAYASTDVVAGAHMLFQFLRAFTFCWAIVPDACICPLGASDAAGPQ